jgi:hypothetical protein
MRAASSPPIWSCSGRGLPCPRGLPTGRWALTQPFHPYPPSPRRRRAVFFLLHWPSRGVWSAVSRFATGRPALRSPDFPPRETRSGRPISMTTHLYYTPRDGGLHPAPEGTRQDGKHSSPCHTGPSVPHGVRSPASGVVETTTPCTLEPIAIGGT